MTVKFTSNTTITDTSKNSIARIDIDFIFLSNKRQTPITISRGTMINKK
ncbi:MAG: hypothetical protein WCW43_01050 [Candidatus Paceibacterota bacterium]